MDGLGMKILAGKTDAWEVPRMWDGERVFIIAGGQSVPRDVLTAANLPGRVIAIKDAAYFQPEADMFFYAERRLHKERPSLWRRYAGPLRVKRSVHDGVPEGVLQVARTKPDLRGINGLSTDRRRLGGHCSGGSALNLAFHLGAAEIVLIGYDLRGAHWNPSHPLRRARGSTHQKHAASIDAMAFPLRQAGVRVWNTSQISALKEYNFAKLTNWL